MLPLDELKDFTKYMADLKTEVIKSKAKIAPFRYYFDFPFNDKARDILLVGKTPPALLKQVKGLAGAIKLEGECRVANQELRLKVESGPAKAERVQKLLKAAKIQFPAIFVEDFEGGAGAREHALVLAESQKKLVAFSNRVAQIGNIGGEAETDAAKVMAQLAKLRTAIAKGADAPQTGKRLEELCDMIAGNVAGLEKKHSGRRAITDDEVAQSQQKETKEELEQLKLAKAVTDRMVDATQTALETILDARKRALAWQKVEMKNFLDNKDAFKRLQDKFRTDEQQMERDLVTAEQALQTARQESDDAGQRVRTLKSKAQKKAVKEYGEAQKKLRKAETELQSAQESLRTLRKEFAEARAAVSAGDKHGTSRHGAHTGLEQQARRAATGGTSADQDGNEWGDSTEKPEPKKSATQGTDPDKVKWTLGGENVELQYETRDGKRVITNERQVMTKFQEIALKLEGRGAKTSTSSNFLSPELEQEAAERAIQVARQCVWDEMWDDQKKDWVPIDRFFVYVGPPRKVRSKGWGHSTSRNTDSDGNNTPKMMLAQANKVLNAFRNGKIDQNQMMKALNVTMVSSDDGGAILQPVARVMIDRAGSGWTNTSQYPTEDKPGWSLKGKKVRKSSEGGDGITAPEATGV